MSIKSFRWTIAALGLAAGATLVACGTSRAPTDDNAGAKDTTTSTIPEETTSSSTSSTLSTSSTSAVPTTTVPEGVLPTDAVAAICDDGRVEIRTARPAALESFETEYAVVLNRVLAPIGLEGGSPTCSRREVFNQDFSKVVMTANDSDGGSHVVVVDLEDLSAVDLSGSREGSGFSNGGPLEEQAIGFEQLPDRIRFTDRVLASVDGEPFVIDPADPTEFTPLSGGREAEEAIPRASSLNFLDFASFDLSSPDGRLILTGMRISSTDTSIIEVATGEFKRLPYECSGIPLGWRDNSSVVVGSSSGTSFTPSDLKVVHLDSNGNVTNCESVLPENDRTLAYVRMRFDRQALMLTVDDSAGEEFYVADIMRLGTEPQSRGLPNWGRYEERDSFSPTDRPPLSWDFYFPSE